MLNLEGITLTQEEIDYIEEKLGWELGKSCMHRAICYKAMGCTPDDIVEALTFL
ncbi:MAG: hypothetical protein RRZ42_05205 [Oscillospiraceae bacterium]